MAEIRKHNPDDGDGIGRLVRDALGEKVRPNEPGSTPKAVTSADDPSDDDHPSAATLPTWPATDGITLQF